MARFIVFHIFKVIDAGSSPYFKTTGIPFFFMMKTGGVLFIFIVTSFVRLFSQVLPANFNLVSNPSFEYNLSLPGVTLDTGFFSNNTCWTRGNSMPSYILFGPKISATSPTSWTAYDGNYFGSMFMGYVKYRISTQQFIDTTFDFRTYYQNKLLQPLLAGTDYYFSIRVGATKFSQNYSQNDIVGNVGVYFSTNKISAWNGTGRMNLTPQIKFTSWNIPFFDSFGYITLSGKYTATGGEQYITIGNFDFFSQQQFIYHNPLSLLADSIVVSSQVFFDNISLVRDTTLPMISLSQFSLGNDTLLCPGDTLVVGGEDHFFHAARKLQMG